MRARRAARSTATAAALLVAALGAGAVANADAAPRGVEGAERGVFVGTAGGVEAPGTQPLRGARPTLAVRSHDVGRRAAEPTIAVDADGNAFYAAANFDSVGERLARTEILRSTDGGVTWASVQPTAPVVKSYPPGNLDPYVWLDPATQRVFSADLLGCGALQYTDDDGETWTPSLAACGDSVDHQTLFGGPPAPEAHLPQQGYPSTLYYCTNRILDARCGRSLDGGRTWVTTATPAYTGVDPAEGGMCNGLHGHGIVDPEGRAILPKGHCGWPYVSISEDGGDTWTRVKVSDTVGAGEPVVPVAEYAGTFPHTSVASDSAGNLYYVWPGPDIRPYLSVSRDHGRTWSDPVMIAPPGITEVNFPTVTAGDAGRIAIVFMGGSPDEAVGALGTTEDDPRHHRPWKYFLLTSTDALDPRPTFEFTTAHHRDDPVHRGDCWQRCGGVFDFLDVVVSPQGEAWATMSDTCVQEACIREGGQVDPDRVGVGFAIRQVSGPSLLDDTAARPGKGRPARPQAPATTVEDRGVLPTTGGGVALLGSVLTATAGPWAWGRHRRRDRRPR